MTPRKDDPRSRIYVGQHFLINDVPEVLVHLLEAFLKRRPQAYAMLEFTSPGRAHRQVDCALVSRGGIDLIEVKRHTGVVEGSADGEWTATYGQATYPMVNKKAGREESPYWQARNTAADLQDWLKATFRSEVRVTPMVFLPFADPRSRIEPRHFNVQLALGADEFGAALQSAPKTHGGWGTADHLELPAKLRLKPMNLSFVQGRVTETLDGKGLPDLDVWAEVQGQRLITRTNAGGYYQFAVQMGSNVQIGFVVPEKYLTPEAILIEADQHYLKVHDVCLPERYSPRTEEEIRQELARDMQARVQEQVQQIGAAWSNTQVQMGLVIDDLNHQLRAVLLQLTERERELQAALRGATQHPLPLPVHVRQVNALHSVATQREQVTDALAQLEGTNNAQQQDTVREVLQVLTRVTASARLELGRPTDAALPVLLTRTTPRLPVPVQLDETTFVEAEELGSPQPSTRPTIRKEPKAASAPVGAAPSGETRVTAPPQRRAGKGLWVAAGLITLAASGLGMVIFLRPAVPPVPAALPVTPAASSAVTSQPSPAGPASTPSQPAQEKRAPKAALASPPSAVAAEVVTPPAPVPPQTRTPEVAQPTQAAAKPVVRPPAKPVSAETTPKVAVQPPTPAPMAKGQAAPVRRAPTRPPVVSSPVPSPVPSPPASVPAPAPSPVAEPTADTTDLPGVAVDAGPAQGPSEVSSDTENLPGVPVN